MQMGENHVLDRINVDIERTERLDRAAQEGVPAVVVGRTGGPDIRIEYGGTTVVRMRVADAEARWADAIGGYFQRAAGAA